MLTIPRDVSFIRFTKLFGEKIKAGVLKKVISDNNMFVRQEAQVWYFAEFMDRK